MVLCAAKRQRAQMRIDRAERFAGQPILRVRDFLRWARDYDFTREAVATRLNVPANIAAKIVAELRRRSWIEPAEGCEGRFTTTMAGNAFAVASAVQPLSRQKAEKLLREFLLRVEEINSRDELSHYVHEVRVFGSYLTKAKLLNDLDLAIDLRWRDVPGRGDPIEYSQKRASESGRHFRSSLAYMGWGEQEVRLILRARSPYISMHPFSDLTATGSRNKRLYKAGKSHA